MWTTKKNKNVNSTVNNQWLKNLTLSLNGFNLAVLFITTTPMGGCA